MDRRPNVSHGLHSHHDDEPDRRDVLKLLGFSLGAAARASCPPIPERRALPLLAQPAGGLPGVARWYAIASPSTRALIAEWQARFSDGGRGARHVVYDPVSLSALRQANGMSFGRPVI